MIFVCSLQTHLNDYHWFIAPYFIWAKPMKTLHIFTILLLTVYLTVGQSSNMYKLQLLSTDQGARGLDSSPYGYCVHMGSSLIVESSDLSEQWRFLRWSHSMIDFITMLQEK